MVSDSQSQLAQLVRFGRQLRESPSTAEARSRLRELCALGSNLITSTPTAEPVDAYRRFLERVAPHVPARIEAMRDDARQRLAALSDRRRAALDTIAGPLDLFGPLHLLNDEVTHTRVVANILHPTRSPHLGVAPLQVLLALLPAVGDGELSDSEVLESADVHPEFVIDLPGQGRKRRPDILIRTNKRLVVIEAKVLAAEGESQLPDYLEWLTQEAAERELTGQLVFLAPPDADASTDVIRVGFRELFEAWLPIACGGSSPAHVFLQLYLGTVGRHLARVSPSRGLEHASLFQLRYLAELSEIKHDH